MVIAGHVIGLSYLYVDTFPEKVMVNLVKGGRRGGSRTSLIPKSSVDRRSNGSLP